MPLEILSAFFIILFAHKIEFHGLGCIQKREEFAVQIAKAARFQKSGSPVNDIIPPKSLPAELPNALNYRNSMSMAAIRFDKQGIKASCINERLRGRHRVPRRCLCWIGWGHLRPIPQSDK